jgi:large subunit ribosomal protein L15
VPPEKREQDEQTEGLTLSNLKPAQKRRARKRIGRGMGSGKGRYSGRGIKGQKSRSGSHTMRPGFEGGQMPIYMRLPKQRGPYSKDALPMGPHRTSTVPVNLRDLERVFDDGAEATLEAMVEKGLIKNTRTDVKVLGQGELTKKLAVTAHSFSASAREKIEQAAARPPPPPPTSPRRRWPRRPSPRPPPRSLPRQPPTSRQERARARCSPGSRMRGGFRSSGAGCSSPP